MRRKSILGSGLLALGAWLWALGAFAQPESLQIGVIDFFGYKGIDLAKVRAAIPLREGDTISESVFEKSLTAIRGAVRKAIGRDATDVNFTCCENGTWLLYIGLPGASSACRWRTTCRSSGPTCSARSMAPITPTGSSSSSSTACS